MKYASLIIIGLLGVILPDKAPAAGNPAATNYPPSRRSFFDVVPARNDVRNSSTLPAIIVNGIDTMRGNPQAALKIQDDAGTRSYVLNRGEEREGVRVDAIDPRAETVTVNNHGRLQKIGLEASAVPVSEPAPVPVAAPEPEPQPMAAVTPTRQSQPDIGPGATVVVIGHRDSPAHINGFAPTDVTPAGGGGIGGFVSNRTNVVNMPNTNASIPFMHPGQINPVISHSATIPASTARIPPPPTIPGGTGGASPDVGGSATTGVQGPPPSAQATPAPMPPSPTKQ